MRRELPIVTEDDDTDIVCFEIEGHTSDAWPELDHFTCLDFVETNDSGNTITNTDDCTVFFDIVLDKDRATTWLMLRILSWMTFAVSAIPSFRDEKGILIFKRLLIMLMDINNIILSYHLTLSVLLQELRIHFLSFPFLLRGSLNSKGIQWLGPWIMSAV